MRHNIFHTLRTAAGIILLLFGIIGLFLPVLQGVVLILIAIPLISPIHGKKMAAELNAWRGKWAQWRQKRKGGQKF